MAGYYEGDTTQEGEIRYIQEYLCPARDSLDAAIKNLGKRAESLKQLGKDLNSLAEILKGQCFDCDNKDCCNPEECHIPEANGLLDSIIQIHFKGRYDL